MKKVAIILAIAVLGAVMFHFAQSGARLSIFHAGSLAKPFEEVEDLFEGHYNVDVQREPSGSMMAIRKITELGKKADIIASADYSLIQNMMIPEYAEWYILFARNEMVIAYTSRSKYADEINENNWYEILGRPDVRFGFSNPNDDPCGYRSMMVVQLAEMYYDNREIFEDLITANANIRVSKSKGVYSIEVSRTEELGPTGKVRIESKSMDLIHLLEISSIDYAFEYRSVAVQGGFSFVELPAEINLSNIRYENIYKQVEVQLAGEKQIVAKPIVYGLTIPKNAEHREEAINFVRSLITSNGWQIFERLGQPPIIPPIASDVDKLPEELQPLFVAWNVVETWTGEIE